MATKQVAHNRCQKSPSPSTTSAGSSQMPTSFKTQLLRRGIPHDRAEELKDKYNRRSIPVMDDDLFFKHLDQIAATVDPEEVERELERFVGGESARIYDDCRVAKFEIGMANMDGLQMDSLHLRLIQSLRIHTAHGFESLVAYLLPPLIEELLRRAHPPKGRVRASRGRKSPHKMLQPQIAQVVEERTPRRSARLSQRPNRNT